MAEERERPVTNFIMAIYDHAESMSESENVPHREVFKTLLEYFELKEEVGKLNQEIRDRTANIVILESLRRKLVDFSKD